MSSAAQFPGVRLGFLRIRPHVHPLLQPRPSAQRTDTVASRGASFFSQQVSKNDESLKNKTELLVAITEIRRCRTVTRAGQVKHTGCGLEKRRVWDPIHEGGL